MLQKTYFSVTQDMHLYGEQKQYVLLFETYIMGILAFFAFTSQPSNTMFFAT